tara:strand:+ start:3439 stop:3681 length:243 start_codon:yes stop_codon:yes gene_type:complete
MPPELRDKLKSASEENHRSMNAEIVARLQESFDTRLDQNTASSLVDSLQQSLREVREMQEETKRHREEAERLLNQVRIKL